MPRKSTHERQNKIVQLIKKNGTMKITELATHFDVSRETIRRDLLVLNDSGDIKKWFGTVMPAHDFEIPPVDNRMSVNQRLKMSVGKKALEFIGKRSAIFIDAGSTALCLATLMKDKSGYTIITNSIPVVNKLATSANHVISIGGSVDPLTMSTMGTQTVEFLDKIKMDVAFLGTSGFAEHKGPTGNSFDDGQIKQKIIADSRTNIVISDSSKATHASLAQYADWHDIDYLITDNQIKQETIKQLNKSTMVVIADN